jgi:hypothetical protein
MMNGGHSISKDFEYFFIEHDIESTPQEIGSTECAIQIVVAMTKHMLEAQKIALNGSNGNYGLYIKLMSDKGLHSNTPGKTWSGRRPCVAHIHVFGSLAYAMVPVEKRDKLDANEIKYIFLSYCKGMKAYRLMYLETSKNKNKK